MVDLLAGTWKVWVWIFLNERLREVLGFLRNKNFLVRQVGSSVENLRTLWVYNYDNDSTCFN